MIFDKILTKILLIKYFKYLVYFFNEITNYKVFLYNKTSSFFFYFFIFLLIYGIFSRDRKLSYQNIVIINLYCCGLKYLKYDATGYPITIS